MPRWHPVSISGYHIREAGSTAAQELAFTLKDGLHLRRAADRARDRRRRLRAAPELLLQRADRLLRGDRQVPRRAPDLGARAARHLRREEPAQSWLMRFHTQTAGVSLTAQQPLNNIVAHRDRGARRRARRHPVAAHELLRRGARAPDRGRGPDRAAHAADHRPRDRRDQHRRPARRLLLRRGADRPHGGAGLRLLRQDRRARRHGRGGQAQLPAARDRRRRASSCRTRSTTATASSSASTATPRATTARRRSFASTPSSSASRSAACRPSARAATAPRSSAALAELREAAAAEAGT